MRFLVSSAVTCAALASAGCAALGHRGAVPESVATSRELCCQGVTALESGQWEEAERLLNQAIENSPTDAVARRHLAEVLWKRGESEQAVREIETALKLAPEDSSLVVRSGQLQLATGSVDKALERAEKAIGLNPKLAGAWTLRGRAHWQTGETDRAVADLQRALQYSPGASDVLIDLAALYRQRGQHQRSLTTVHHLLDRYTPGEEPQFALFLQGLALAEMGRTEEAREKLTLASQRGGPNAEILYHLARAELNSGRHGAATTAANQALLADATHAPSRDLLAQLARSGSNGETRVR